MRHFCTLFNSAYQFHAHLLYNSIAKFYNDCTFYFFCFDEVSCDYFNRLNLNNVIIISSQELEATFPDLEKSKHTRNLVEYFFTCTPSTCKYVMEQYKVDEIVYLDADLFFYQSPEILFAEISKSSVSIIPHRFNFINKFRNVFGYYNVGWVSFKNDKQGIACLNSWYFNNIEWCYDKLTLTKYADQKYLNYWKKNFNNVHVIKHIGANVAPWNVGNNKISIRGTDIYVGESPLVFYHFASLKLIDGKYYTTISSYFSKVSSEVVSLIYHPYITRIEQLGFAPKASIRLNKNFVIDKIRKSIRIYFNDFI